MYQKFFKLNEPPFQLSPDPRFLFESRQHSRAKAYMESTIWLADGFVVITGEIGAGKTTLIESFLNKLPDNVILAQIKQTQLKPVEFLQSLLLEFGFQEFHNRKVELLSIIRKYIENQHAQGKTLLLIVDEAQNLSRKVLEEIRLLSGIETQNEKPLRIILAGQPELSDKLDSKRLEQLSQRVRLKFHLSTLNKLETKQYIQHRLNVAGSAGRHIFDDDAMETVFLYSGGVPRLTNLLCDTAMVCGFSDGRIDIGADLVIKAANELGWVEHKKRKKSNQTIDQNNRSEPNLDASAPQGGQRPSASGPRAYFDVSLENQRLIEFALPIGRSMVGRQTGNDLQLVGPRISRHHLLIITDEAKTVLEDLNSTNGVFLGSERIQRHTLVDGDVVHLGNYQLIYHDLRAKVSTSSDSNDLEPGAHEEVGEFDGTETCA